MRTTLRAGWMLTLLVAVAFGIASANIPGKKMLVNVTDRDANGVVEVTPSGMVEVALESNASTGYMWYLKKFNPRVMAPVKKEGEYKQAAGSPPGAPGVQIFRFKALNQGTDTIELVYMRAHSKEHAKAFKITVRVGNKALPAKPIKTK